MPTKTVELIRVMCAQYWPLEVGIPQKFDGVIVNIEHEERLANFYIRTITIKMEDEANNLVIFISILQLFTSKFFKSHQKISFNNDNSRAHAAYSNSTTQSGPVTRSRSPLPSSTSEDESA